MTVKAFLIGNYQDGFTAYLYGESKQAILAAEKELIGALPVQQKFYNPDLRPGFIDAFAEGWVLTIVEHSTIGNDTKPQLDSIANHFDNSTICYHKDTDLYIVKIFDSAGKLMQLPIKAKEDANKQTAGKRIGRLLRLSSAKGLKAIPEYINIKYIPGYIALDGQVVAGSGAAALLGVRRRGSITMLLGDKFVKGHIVVSNKVPVNDIYIAESNIKRELAINAQWCKDHGVKARDVVWAIAEEVHGNDHVMIDVQSALNLLAVGQLRAEKLVKYLGETVRYIVNALTDREKFNEIILSIDDGDAEETMPDNVDPEEDELNPLGSSGWRLKEFIKAGVDWSVFRPLVMDVIRLVGKKFYGPKWGTGKADESQWPRVFVPGAKRRYLTSIVKVEDGKVFFGRLPEGRVIVDQNNVCVGWDEYLRLKPRHGGPDFDDSFVLIKKGRGKYLLYRNPNQLGEYSIVRKAGWSNVEWVPAAETPLDGEAKAKAEAPQAAGPKGNLPADVAKAFMAVSGLVDTLTATAIKAIGPTLTEDEKLLQSVRDFAGKAYIIGRAANVEMLKAALKVEIFVFGNKDKDLMALYQTLQENSFQFEPIIDRVQKGSAEGYEEQAVKVEACIDAIKQSQCFAFLAPRFFREEGDSRIVKDSIIDNFVRNMNGIVKEVFGKLQAGIADQVYPHLSVRQQQAIAERLAKYGRKLRSYFDYKGEIAALNKIEELKRDVDARIAKIREINKKYSLQFMALCKEDQKAVVYSVLEYIATSNDPQKRKSQGYLFINGVWQVLLEVLCELGIGGTKELKWYIATSNFFNAALPTFEVRVYADELNLCEMFEALDINARTKHRDSLVEITAERDANGKEIKTFSISVGGQKLKFKVGDECRNIDEGYYRVDEVYPYISVKTGKPTGFSVKFKLRKED